MVVWWEMTKGGDYLKLCAFAHGFSPFYVNSLSACSSPDIAVHKREKLNLKLCPSELYLGWQQYSLMYTFLIGTVENSL